MSQPITRDLSHKWTWRRAGKVFLSAVLDYGLTILTILSAAGITFLARTTQLSPDALLAWILALLFLIATTLLVDRLRMLERIRTTGESTLAAVQSLAPSGRDQFLLDHLPPLGPFIAEAADISLSGIVLQRTVRDNMDLLVGALRRGACIRVILVDPSSQAALNISGEQFPLDQLKADFNATWNNLRSVLKRSEGKGSLQMRLASKEPYFNLHMFDPAEERGTLFVELRPQCWPASRGRPRLQIKREADQYWFDYYKEQFDSLWACCAPVNLQQ